MDIQLQKSKLGGFRPVYQTLLRQEETLESIVPDALPDISRIVQASGIVLLRQKETVDGSIRVTGNVRCSVLYVSEEGSAPCCLTLNIPFLCSGDHPALKGGCPAQVTARVLSADAQLLNPRKVLARVELCVEVTAWGEEQAEVCAGPEDGGDESVQSLIETFRDFAAVDVAEKSFSFSDILHLPSSKPAMEQLLGARAELSCGEARVIGKKLVVKGQAVLTALYRSAEGAEAARFELPFSQIVEVKEGDDECSVQAEAVLTGLECLMRSEGELEVSFEILLQTAVRKEREVSLLSDLYSVSQPLETEREKVVLTPLVEQGSRRCLARQYCESAIPARQVVDCRITMGEPEWASGEHGTATVKGFAEVLYISEDGSLCAVSYTVPVSCELPVREGCRCDCSCVPAGEPTATPVTGGLEIRYEAEFRCVVTRRDETFCISEVRPGLADPAAAERPSVVIRVVGEGERMWDIAKCCGSTVADIRAANAMEGAEACAGTLLLIPKCR